MLYKVNNLYLFLIFCTYKDDATPGTPAGPPGDGETPAVPTAGVDGEEGDEEKEASPPKTVRFKLNSTHFQRVI